MLRLIGSHAPAHHVRAFCPPGACARHTPVWCPPAAHGWKAFPALFVLRTPGLFPSPRRVYRFDNAVDHAVVILQRHFSGTERIILFRLFRCHGKGPCAVSHDKILSIIGNMVDAITGCLHLLPTHSRHLKAAPRCLHTFASFKTVWQISKVLFLCGNRENNDIAIDLHKSFRRLELLRVFLDQFRGPAGR